MENEVIVQYLDASLHLLKAGLYEEEEEHFHRLFHMLHWLRSELGGQDSKESISSGKQMTSV